MTAQPFGVPLPAATVTSPWKPPCQELVVRKVAVHDPPVDGEPDGDADGDVEGEVDGDTEVDGDGDAVDGVTLGEVDGSGAELARLYARSGWNDPAA